MCPCLVLVHVTFGFLGPNCALKRNEKYLNIQMKEKNQIERTDGIYVFDKILFISWGDGCVVEVGQ